MSSEQVASTLEQAETFADALAHLVAKRPLPAFLFHYTNPAGLYGIVTSRSIRASCVHHLNDESEITHAVDIASEIVKEEMQTPPSGILSDDDAVLLQLLYKMLMHREALENKISFVAAFSEEGDLLSQWRAYGGKGGYSIEFDARDLAQFGRKAGFELAPCFYDREEQKTLLRFAVRDCVEAFRVESANHEHDERSLEQHLHSVAASYFRLMARLAPRLKHPSFSEEREWRLVGTHSPDRNDLDFRAAESLLVPFVSVPVAEDGAWTYRGFVVGPTPSPKASFLSANMLFENHNVVNMNGRQSNTPFRSW